MKKLLMLFVLCLLVTFFCGCGGNMMYLKFPAGWTCYKSATVRDIANIKDSDAKFLGPNREPEIRKTGEIVAQTDDGETYSIPSDMLFDINDPKDPSDTYRLIRDFSPQAVNRKVTIYILNDKVIGIAPQPGVYYRK